MQRRPGQKKQILVIDDDLDILDFLHELLEMEGYAVAVSSRGNTLEELEEEQLPDLVLLDVFLSGKDGRDMVKHLKTQEETRQIPVIMFSAYPSSEAAARAVGADDFLAKPFNVDMLLEKVQTLLV